MYPSSDAPPKPAVQVKRKKSSKRQTPRAVQDGFQDDYEGDVSFDTGDQTSGRREITSRHQSSSPVSLSANPSSPSSVSQEPSFGSPPRSNSHWEAYHQSTQRGKYASYRPNSFAPSLAPPQSYSRKPHSTQSPTRSPQNQSIDPQRPSHLHADSPVQRARFPYHPPTSSVNVPRRPGFGNAATQTNDMEARPYFRSLDTLQACGDVSSSAMDYVVLSGYYGWLDVFNVDRRHTKLIGRLDVKGDMVLGAKIVPCKSRQDDFREYRPLVAVILHGPAHASGGYDADQPTSPGEKELPLEEGSQTNFQTRVEVWSLKDGSHISSLYKSPHMTASHFPWAQQATLQQETADLTIDAQDGFIVVASGISGEVFVFAPSRDNMERLGERFRCIAKFWTTIRAHSLSGGTDSQTVTAEDDSQPSRQAPIFSLSQRWLAIVPPSTPSRHSVQGLVPISPNDGRPPGVESVTAPPPPSSNCTLDIPDPESLTNKMAKGVAKEVVRGAQWVGAQGWQAWQNYWNKPSQPIAEPSAWNERAPNQQFPPTHAKHQRESSEDGDSGNQVSIIDLQQLVRLDTSRVRNRHEPIATFTPPAGCSFLSFSPNGLLLLTVSQNGDTQHVWDLLQLRGRKAGNKNQLDPSMRQVARFSRFTNAIVVDVAWSAPKGDKIAMVTDKGTVHVFKLPTTAFMWPAPRRHSSHDPSADTAQTSQSSTSAQSRVEDTRLPVRRPSALSSAASRVSDTTRPIVETVRQRSNSSVSVLTSNLGEFSFSTAAGLQKGKALAAGVSKSLGVAAGQINQIRRASESRFHIKRGGNLHPGCVRFLTGPDRGFIGALSNESLLFHWLHPASSSTSTSVSKDCELALTDTIPASVTGTAPIPAPPVAFFYPKPTSGEATGTSAECSSADLAASSSIHPLAHAELESNAPFQPFYTDRRITLSTYRSPEPWDHDHDNDASPWAFGNAIPSDAMECSVEQSRVHLGMQAPDLSAWSDEQKNNAGGGAAAGEGAGSTDQTGLAAREAELLREAMADAMSDADIEADIEADADTLSHHQTEEIGAGRAPSPIPSPAFDADDDDFF